jgi:spore germination protein
MYGYDWTLNAQGTPLKRASALSLNQINKMEELNSDMKTTALPSREKKKEYRDAEGQKHVIWYEDEDSVTVKEEYLMQQGIGSISYWVYGYF